MASQSSVRRPVGDWQRQHAAGLLTAAAGLLWYVLADPRSPDLAAQAARAALARGSGVTDWWLGWFGGLQMPSYSILAPSTMAVIGTVGAGCVATVISVLAMSDLLRDTRRPVAASTVFAVLCLADVAAGRLTFALAVAVALVCLMALRRNSALALALGLLCGMVSLLAAFFLGVAAISVALVDPVRRRKAATLAVLLLGEGVVGQLIFSQTGTMPYAVHDLLLASGSAAFVALCVRNRHIRAGAWLMTILPLAVMLDPGAMGENIVRLCWIVAAPLLVAEARPIAWQRVAAAGCLLVIWPLVNTADQVFAGHSASAQSNFYPALSTALRDQLRAAGMAATGERVEVVPTRAHWETHYLVTQFQLARGWDRQADVADNPLFYGDALAAEDYRQWLGDLAVGWVARPHTRLDQAGVQEAAVIDGGQSYLQLVWHDKDWDLYRVKGATPLVSGADVQEITPTTITVHFSHPGTATVRLRWTRYLNAMDAAGLTSRSACLVRSGEFTSMTATQPGSYVIGADLKIKTAPRCVRTPS